MTGSDERSSLDGLRQSLGTIATRRRWAIRIAVLAIPGISSLLLGSMLVLGIERTEELWNRFLPSMAGLLGLTGAWYASTRCPRCRGFFFWRTWASNPFTSECMNCGVEVPRS
jgi:hypothetical protein